MSACTTPDAGWQLVPLATVVPTPWRNGGGVTRELLAWPGPAEWQVRLSVAEVGADGPFSAFTGIERWFAVLEGEGVALTVDGTAHRLDTTSAPLCFDGGTPVDCRLLAGPTLDFNLMAPPGRARMLRIREGLHVAVGAGTLVAAYAHADPVTLPGLPGALPARTLAWRVTQGPWSGRVQARETLWMEVAA